MLSCLLTFYLYPVQLIPRNTVVPTKKSQTFTTYQDQQTTVSIQVSVIVRSLLRSMLGLGVYMSTFIAAFKC